MYDRLQTLCFFWGEPCLRKLGNTLAFPSHGSTADFTARLPSLDYNTYFLSFFLIFTNTVEAESLGECAGRARECTAPHTSWSPSREILAGNHGCRLGSDPNVPRLVNSVAALVMCLFGWRLVIQCCSIY